MHHYDECTGAGIQWYTPAHRCGHVLNFSSSSISHHNSGSIPPHLPERTEIISSMREFNWGLHERAVSALFPPTHTHTSLQAGVDLLKRPHAFLIDIFAESEKV